MTKVPSELGAGSLTGRVASVDAVRGLTIVLMVLVNDAGEAPAAPDVLKHAPAHVNGMTPADVVFPAFLFVMGMSVPLALRRHLAAGSSRVALWRRVAGRTLALLIMGLFMAGRDDNTGWRPNWWIGLMYLCFFAVWSVPPAEPGWRRGLFTATRALGIAGLVALAVVYRGPGGERLVFDPLFNPEGEVWLRHEGWGILGSLGWAYLATCAAYALVGKRRGLLLLAVPLAALAYVIETGRDVFFSQAAQLEFFQALRRLLAWGSVELGLGRMAAMAIAMSMAGCALGTLLVDGRATQQHRQRIQWGAALAVGLAGAAWLLDPLYGVSKPAGTPSWAYYSCAISAALWTLVYWIMDVRGFRAWARPLQPAGANPLTAYILHPLVRGALLIVPGLHVLQFYKAPHHSPWVATLGAASMTAFIVWCTAQLARWGIRLKV